MLLRSLHVLIGCPASPCSRLKPQFFSSVRCRVSLLAVAALIIISRGSFAMPTMVVQVGGTVVGWLFSTLLVMLMPCAVILSCVLRRGTHFLQGPIVPRGKVVLITGASSGIGRHIALEYARRGAKLVIAARREHLLHEVAEQCKALGAQSVHIRHSDVSREEDCKNMINFTVNTLGGLDILVNNAGTTQSCLFEESNPTEFSYVFSVDFWGNVYPTLYALDHLKQSKGHIVVTSSVAAYIPYPYLSFYTAAKGAIVNFYDTLRVESLLKNDIGITLAFPGFVETEMTQKEPSGHIPKWWPMISAEITALAIVEGTTQRRRYVVVPGWYITSLLYRVFAPEILTWLPQIFILGRDRINDASRSRQRLELVQKPKLEMFPVGPSEISS